MLKQINQVKEFHKKFNIYYADKVSIPEESVISLREKLIFEEYKEVAEEILDCDSIEKVAKELCDLLYVTYGTILAFGLQDKIEECFDEVQRSNLSKLGKDGKPQYRGDGKLLKGDNYSPADLSKILK